MGNDGLATKSNLKSVVSGLERAKEWAERGATETRKKLEEMIKSFRPDVES